MPSIMRPTPQPAGIPPIDQVKNQIRATDNLAPVPIGLSDFPSAIALRNPQVGSRVDLDRGHLLSPSRAHSSLTRRVVGIVPKCAHRPSTNLNFKIRSGPVCGVGEHGDYSTARLIPFLECAPVFSFSSANISRWHGAVESRLARARQLSIHSLRSQRSCAGYW